MFHERQDQNGLSFCLEFHNLLLYKRVSALIVIISSSLFLKE